MKDKRFSWKALLLTAALTLVLTLGGVVLAAWLRLGPDGLAVLESMELVRHGFVGEYDEDRVIDAALSGLVDALGDRWSYYLNAEEYAAMEQRRHNSYVGVGLTYIAAEDGTYFTVVELTPGAPAEAAGLQVGERVTAIDGRAFTPENFDTLMAEIPQMGREMTFTVADENGDIREVKLKVAQVESLSVTYELLEGGIGYVRMTNFYIGSAQQAKTAVDDLVEQGARALLFDVRSNPGGYVDELTDLLDHLLGEGPIFSEHTKNGPVRVTTSDAARVDLPMAVLVNADSYSAAEMFAAQLRESVQAPLIGVQTFGKGYYQQTFALPNGGGLNISTGMYATGKGTSLIGVGLIPDVVEEDPEAQLEQGLECLKKGLGEGG